jgi:MoxR-like ATPase
MSLDEVARSASAIVDEVERAVVGKREVVELVLAGLLADGHLLLEDLPGVAKTLIARSLAQAVGLDFARVQFTPDLMPADITGSTMFNQQSGHMVFAPGPVFTNLLLGDEINRAPPKTQAALLEAMQERQVTIDGETRRLGPPFLVMATQNPIEFEGTYPLPEAQLDRFMLRVSVGYPGADAEWTVLARRLERGTPDTTLRSVVDRDEFVAMQLALERVHVSEGVGRYIVALVASTRSRPTVEVGASPRGSLAVLAASRARAVLAGRDFVVPEDVKAVAVSALAHRIRLRADLWVRGVKPESVVEECMHEVPTPSPDEVVRP